MLEAKIVSVSVRRNWRELYDEFWMPEAFPRWASGLSEASLERHGDHWTAQGPGGPVRIDFTPCNAFGVMDHRVLPAEGQPIHVPLRIVENQEGAEVMLTLYRQPGMTGEKFAEDEAWVRRDLLALKALAEV